VNAVDYRPGKFAKIGEFAKVWEREVLAHKKPSSDICASTFGRGSVMSISRSSPGRRSKISPLGFRNAFRERPRSTSSRHSAR
jgi:hypothetical protein